MHAAPGPNDVGLRVIIFYKMAKGAVALVLSLALAVGLQTGLVEAVQRWIVEVNSHLTRAWSIRLAQALLAQVTHSHVVLASVALALDGALTSVEGWGLHTRKRWAEWLVVVASGMLLPVEVYELVDSIKVTRVLVLAANLTVVVYLALRLRREKEASHTAA